MTLSSSMFIFGLLPWFLLFVWVTRNIKNSRKIFLMIANSIFYIWSGVGGFLFFCVYIVCIWLLCKLLQKTKNNKYLFICIILIAITPLLVTKYYNFTIRTINTFFRCPLEELTWLIPTGISFFTFEAVALLLDIHSGAIGSTPCLSDTFLYLSFFPTVTSGPIIRYADFQKSLYHWNQQINYNDCLRLLIIGLSKKLLIADKIAPLANYYFDGIAMGNKYSGLGLWVGSIAYTLQIYFDFSGYSDIAISIAGMLGFEVKKNFDKPYQAKSITEFWRKWHISLSQWFRDYIYIPLGGNRCSKKRNCINLLIVWFLTGLWHGADWTYIIWGIGYCLILIIEKYTQAVKIIAKKKGAYFYTLFFVNILWVIFRAENLSNAKDYILGMFQFNCFFNLEPKAIRYLPFIILVFLLCLPYKSLAEKLDHCRWIPPIIEVGLVILAFLDVCTIANTTYVPFIYGMF